MGGPKRQSQQLVYLCSLSFTAVDAEKGKTQMLRLYGNLTIGTLEVERLCPQPAVSLQLTAQPEVSPDY